MPITKHGDLKGVDALDVSFENMVKSHYPKLSLPNYQRNFVWDKQKIITFLEDLIINRESPNIPNMFAGSVLMLRGEHSAIDYQKYLPEKLQSMKLSELNKLIAKLHLANRKTEKAAIKALEKERPKSKIIDGQQRITTCFILSIILKGKLSQYGGTKTLSDRLEQIIQTSNGQVRLELIKLDNDDLRTIFKKHKPKEPITSDRKESIWSNRGAGNSKNYVCDAYTCIHEWVDLKLSTLNKSGQKKWLTSYTKYFL